jgi:electron transfer flavoprotein alpha subunit
VLRAPQRTLTTMIAVIPVRDGVLPAGADEVVAECAGNVLLVGTGLAEVELAAAPMSLTHIDLGSVQFGRWATQISLAVGDLDGADHIVLPHAPDGRDLAPRLALELDRTLFAGAMSVTPDEVVVIRNGGRDLHRHRPSAPFVATLQPGVRGVDTPSAAAGNTAPATITPDASGDVHDAVVIEVLPPDVRTMDLSEADRIVGGGAGLDAEERFAQLAAFAVDIDATMGATRVITDRSWVHHDKQIGTTGVVVDPRLYISFGVSGAVQHTAGLGSPEHIISINTDPHCAMMQMSDLAIVSDANATLDALTVLLTQRSPSGDAGMVADG